MVKHWMIYDPEEGVDFFETEESATEEAKRRISKCCDNGPWLESVDGILVAKVTHVTEQANVVDKDMLDECGEYNGRAYTGEYESWCDYLLVPANKGDGNDT